ncbi:MAG TPA: hypothetical protein VFC38_01350 [Stellaceae bacterium]|nr:hypothetical protein [Stellaceae bacterium]
MAFAEAVVLKEPWEVRRRLAELQLTLEGLLKVRAKALSAGADATPYHPANAAGTFAYQHGTWALRDEFTGENWKLDRPNGVEVIRNEKLKLSVVFANVDVACNDEIKPKPRSRKGSGAERVCGGNLFPWLPEYAPVQAQGEATFYLMVAENGAAELTRPVVDKGTFSAYPERIYLSDGSDLDRQPVVLDEGEVADGFDPQVVRK